MAENMPECVAGLNRLVISQLQKLANNGSTHKSSREVPRTRVILRTLVLGRYEVRVPAPAAHGHLPPIVGRSLVQNTLYIRRRLCRRNGRLIEVFRCADETRIHYNAKIDQVLAVMCAASADMAFGTARLLGSFRASSPVPGN
jgi:hypothetical protein